MYALITGASKGIGRAIAEELAKKKIDLLLVARTESSLQEIKNSFPKKYNVDVQYLPIDLSLDEAPDAIYKWVADKDFSISILVNNAGYGLSGSFEKYNLAENEGMMQLNMFTPVKITQLFLSQLKEKSEAYILNIASTAAYQAVPGLTLYAATKAFILSFSRGLREELKKTSVSVTCVSPGPVDTDWPKRAQIGTKASQAAEKINMQPEEIARIAVKSMFSKKAEVIPGMINKTGAFFSWLLPKEIVERVSGKLYQ